MITPAKLDAARLYETIVRPAVLAGWTDREVAETIRGTTYHGVRRYRRNIMGMQRRPGKPVPRPSEQMRADMLKMRSDGATYQAIADAHHVSLYQAWSCINK